MPIFHACLSFPVPPGPAGTALWGGGTLTLAAGSTPDLRFDSMAIRFERQPHLAAVDDWLRVCVQAILELTAYADGGGLDVEIVVSDELLGPWTTGIREDHALAFTDAAVRALQARLEAALEGWSDLCDSVSVRLSSGGIGLADPKVIDGLLVRFEQELTPWATSGVHQSVLVCDSMRPVSMELDLIRRLALKSCPPSLLLWRLLELDQPIIDANDVLDLMSVREWDAFCRIAERYLLEALDTDPHRYALVPRCRRIAKSLPVDSQGAPPRLAWIQDRSLTKCDSHEGVAFKRWSDHTSEMVLDAGNGIFRDALERLQAQIEVALDDAQMRFVNPLRPDLDDGNLDRLRDRYMAMFPEARLDANIARLAGTSGQLLALGAPFKDDRHEHLRQARELFLLDLQHCPDQRSAEKVAGYLTLVEYDLGEADAMSVALDRETSIVLSSRSASERSLLDNVQNLSFLLQQVSPFLVLHRLQHAWLARKPVPGLSDLAQAYLGMPSTTAGAYPYLQVGKWVGLLLDRDGDAAKALQCFQQAMTGWGPDRPCGNATDLIRASIDGLCRELRSDDGLSWLQAWGLRQLVPGQLDLNTLVDRARAESQSDPTRRMQLMIDVLPFYFH